MADDERSALGRVGDGVVAAVEIAGVAMDMSKGFVGPMPDQFVAPATEHTAIVESVETPDWAYTTTDDLVQQAGEVMEAEMEAASDEAVELGEALDAPESSWEADASDDIGESWAEADAGDDVGESWAEAGDPGDAGDGGDSGDSGDGADGSGGAW